MSRGAPRVGRIFLKAPYIARLSQYEHGKFNKGEKRAGRLRRWANDKRMMIQIPSEMRRETMEKNQLDGSEGCGRDALAAIKMRLTLSAQAQVCKSYVSAQASRTGTSCELGI